jgi:acetolactate synthase-1/2/3 large subunit
MRKPRKTSRKPSPRSQPWSDIDRPVKFRQRNRPQYASDAIAATLRNIGFEYAFLNPGSSYRGLHDSLVNFNGNRGPKAVLCSHEDICVHMAQGYSKATGRASLAILHDLVGLMHGTMAVYNSFCDRQPVVVLGGSGPADPKLRRAVDYHHSANVQGELVRPFVKWDDEAVPGADPDVVNRVADMLLGAKFPVITGGFFNYDPAATRPLRQLVEIIGAAYVEDRRCTCMPTNHPQNLTEEPGIVERADVLLAVDSRDVADIVGGYSSRVRGQLEGGVGATKLVDLSQNAHAYRSWSRAGGKIAPTTEQMLADPVVGMKQLTAAIKAKLGRGRKHRAAIEARKARFARVKARLVRRQQAELKRRWGDTPISPHRFVHEIYEAVKRKPWVLTNRGHRAWPEGIWEFSGCGDCLGYSGGGGVGYGPGSLVGASLAARDQGRFPVGVMGDGDFMMQAGALWTAVHERVPLLCIINNNTSWWNDEQHQGEVAEMRGRPTENQWIATTTRDPEVDLAAIARSYGAWAEGPVEDPDELGPALRRAVKEVEANQVVVLNVRTTPG